MDSKKNDEIKTDVDIFRDTPLRYMGYANEVGEAFRALVSHTVVKASYAVAFGYVFMDVIDKGTKTYKKEIKFEPSLNEDSATIKTVKTSADCLVWQTLASVLVPGFTINRICALSLFVLNKSNVNTLVRSSKIITTGIGLASIPMIIHPIDHLVHVVMDKFRPTFGISPYYKNEKE